MNSLVVRCYYCCCCWWCAQCCSAAACSKSCCSVRIAMACQRTNERRSLLPRIPHDGPFCIAHGETDGQADRTRWGLTDWLTHSVQPRFVFSYGTRFIMYYSDIIKDEHIILRRDWKWRARSNKFHTLFPKFSSFFSSWDCSNVCTLRRKKGLTCAMLWLQMGHHCDWSVIETVWIRWSSKVPKGKNKIKEEAEDCN